MSSLSNELKSTIGRIAALQSVVTDPGHILYLSRALLRWVRVGLVVKYRKIPDHYKRDLDYFRDLWDQAQKEYGSSNEAWPLAMMKCSDIADYASEIAGLEDLMDYKEFDFDLTQALFGDKVKPEDQQGGESNE
ncbi:MAG: hypothetical protein WC489_07280 [Patescibacteria group bacterium]|jgi:hypothetical protein